MDPLGRFDQLAAEQHARVQPASAVCRDLVPGKHDVELFGAVAVDRRHPPLSKGFVVRGL